MVEHTKKFLKHIQVRVPLHVKFKHNSKVKTTANSMCILTSHTNKHKQIIIVNRSRVINL